MGERELKKELREYLETIGDISEDERSGLLEWVGSGNSVYDNPGCLCDEGGRPLDYIDGIRICESLYEDHVKGLLDKESEAEAAAMAGSKRCGSVGKSEGKGYAQVKAYVKPEAAAAFKEKCLKENVSVSCRLGGFIYGEIKRNHPIDAVTTRRQRRRAVGVLMTKLGEVMSAEIAYRENIPENLRNSNAYDVSCRTVEVLEEALDLLGEAYWDYLCK